MFAMATTRMLVVQFMAAPMHDKVTLWERQCCKGLRPLHFCGFTMLQQQCQHFSTYTLEHALFDGHFFIKSNEDDDKGCQIGAPKHISKQFLCFCIESFIKHT